MRSKGPIILFQALVLGAACVSFASAQSPQKNQSVYLYQGADRAQRLAERARQEGTLVMYTSLATSESVPLTQAFEKKYGVKVQLWRSLSDQVVRRALNEAKARRHVVDVVETNGPELEALARERVTAPFFSPHIADIPPWGVPAHRRWVSDRVDFFVVAFNTAKVRREELPATYEGFLDPKWKGRIGLEATDQEWLAGLAKHWGGKGAPAFFRAPGATRAARPQGEGADRPGSDRSGVARRPRQALGREARPRFFPRAGRDAARRTQGARAAVRDGRGRRGARQPHQLRIQRRFDEAPRQADRLEAGRAGDR